MLQYRHGLNTQQQFFRVYFFTKYMLIHFLREKLLLWNNTGKTALHIGVKESFNTQANSH